MQQRNRLTILILSILFVFLTSGFSDRYLSLNDYDSKDLPKNISVDIPQTEDGPDEDICGLYEPDCEDASASLTKNIEVDLVRAENAQVNIIFFWMQDCAHCTEVLNSILPEMYLTYAEKIYFYPIELKEITEIDLFYQMAERLGVPKNNIGVPLMIIGDQVLAGNQIENNLEKSIAEFLPVKDYSLIAIPEFEEKLPDFLRNKQVDIDTANPNQSGNTFPLRSTFPLAFVIGLPLLAIAGVFVAMIYKKSKQIS